MSPAALPLSSDPVAARRPLVLEPTRAAARLAARWREEARLATRARALCLGLHRAGSHFFGLYVHEDEPEYWTRRRVRELVRRAVVCLDQDDLQAALGREEPLVICYSEQGRAFSAQGGDPQALVVLGDAQVDLRLSGGSCYLGGQVHGLVGPSERAAGGEAFPCHVEAFGQAQLDLLGRAFARVKDRAAVRALSPEVSLELAAGARCELHAAEHVYASAGALVTLAEGARCQTIELDEPWDKATPPARIVDAAGALLYEAGPELEDSELRGIKIRRAIPF